MQAKQYIGESWKHGILILGAILVLLPFYSLSEDRPVELEPELRPE